MDCVFSPYLYLLFTPPSSSHRSLLLLLLPVHSSSAKTVYVAIIIEPASSCVLNGMDALHVSPVFIVTYGSHSPLLVYSSVYCKLECKREGGGGEKDEDNLDK